MSTCSITFMEIIKNRTNGKIIHQYKISSSIVKPVQKNRSEGTCVLILFSIRYGYSSSHVLIRISNKETKIDRGKRQCYYLSEIPHIEPINLQQKVSRYKTIRYFNMNMFEKCFPLINERSYFDHTSVTHSLCRLSRMLY